MNFIQWNRRPRGNRTNTDTRLFKKSRENKFTDDEAAPTSFSPARSLYIIIIIAHVETAPPLRFFDFYLFIIIIIIFHYTCKHTRTILLLTRLGRIRYFLLSRARTSPTACPGSFIGCPHRRRSGTCCASFNRTRCARVLIFFIFIYYYFCYVHNVIVCLPIFSLFVYFCLPQG